MELEREFKYIRINSNNIGKVIVNKRTNIPITITVYILMAVYAVSVTMLGPLIPVLIKFYNIGISQGGLFVTFINVGGIAAIFLGAFLADRISKPLLLTAAFLTYILCLVVISTSPYYIILLLLFLILGIGTRIIDLTANAFIAELHIKKRGLYLSLLHGCFAIGALAGPIFSQYFLSGNIRWNIAFLALGGICTLVLSIYMLILKFKYNKESGHLTQRVSIDLSTILKSPVMWILCMIMVMYSAHQSGVNTWWYMYMKDSIGASKIISSLSLSLFWAGIIIGRFTCSYMLRYINQKQIIIWGNLTGGIVLTAGIILSIPTLLIFAISFAGFLTGAVIPLLITIACDWFPTNTGTITSIIFFSSTMANTISPWLIGVFIENFGFQHGIVITGITLLIGFFVALSIPLKSKQLE